MSEAVLIKSAEGMSYASILRELKKRVKPDELGAKVLGSRETRSKDLLREMKCSTKDRGWLDTAFKEAIVEWSVTPPPPPPPDQGRDRRYRTKFESRSDGYPVGCAGKKS